MSTQDDTRSTTRRGLFRLIGRTAALGAAGVAAWALGRRGDGPRSACINASRCRTCRALGDCILPAAQYFRAGSKEGA